MEFLRSFLRRHLAGKPVVTSHNVGCFLTIRLLNITIRYDTIQYLMAANGVASRRGSIWTMKHQTIPITFPCQSNCAFSWRYIVGIPRRSNTHCDGSWFPCGLHHFHYPLSFFYKLKILSEEGNIIFSLRAKVPFCLHTGYVVCKSLKFLILTSKLWWLRSTSCLHNIYLSNE